MTQIKVPFPEELLGCISHSQRGYYKNREKKIAKAKRYYERVMADPIRRARYLAKVKENKVRRLARIMADPILKEEYNIKNTAKSKRNHQKMMMDPIRKQKYTEQNAPIWREQNKIYRNRRKEDFDKKHSVFLSTKAEIMMRFRENGCALCLEKAWQVLDCHHHDANQKKFTIASAQWGRNVPPQTLLDELAKCVCLCSNCHRKVHANLLQCPLPSFDINEVMVSLKGRLTFSLKQLSSTDDARTCDNVNRPETTAGTGTKSMVL